MTGSAPAGVRARTDLADPVMFEDPYPVYAELRRNAPVAPAYSKQMLDGAGYIFVRHEHVLLLHNDARFSSEPSLGGSSSFLVRHLPRTFRLLMDSMVFKDDPDHTRLRRLVNKAFTPRRVQELTEDIERIVGDLLDRVEQRGAKRSTWWQKWRCRCRCRSSRSCSVCGDEDRDEFHVLMERFVDRMGSGSPADALKGVPTARKLYAVLQRLADQRRAEPDDGLISALLEASEEGDSLSDEEVMGMIFLLMLAGHDTTANLIGSASLALMEHPDQAERWRADAGLTTSAVEELLRFTTPVPCGAARTLLADVEVDGTTLRQGSKVLGMIISANRDEAVFERPDELDLGRDPNKHLTFAFGKHFCLGNQLARLEGQIAIGELVRRFPDLRLAVPREQLQYKPMQSLRGFRSLPVKVR